MGTTQPVAKFTYEDYRTAPADERYELLDDPATRGKLDLLQPDQRAPVQVFMASRLLPAQPGRDFIDAVAQVLSGLSKVIVTADDLRRALFPGGSPATPRELKKRFGDYLDEQAKGLDEAKVRIVIE